ncbi:unnamed protein product [Choristocarpus tenellus]
MWAAVMTRPDIADAVREVAKYSSSPKTAHWCAVRRVFEYLNTSKCWIGF